MRRLWTILRRGSRRSRGTDSRKSCAPTSSRSACGSSRKRIGSARRRSNDVSELVAINRLIRDALNEEAIYFVAGGRADLRQRRGAAGGPQGDVELVNDVMFLLEGQVMQAADATTPMRQLYFIVQLMLMNPTDIGGQGRLAGSISALLAVCENAEMLDGLEAIDELVGATRYYEALRKIRALFEVEEAILTGTACQDLLQSPETQAPEQPEGDMNVNSPTGVQSATSGSSSTSTRRRTPSTTTISSAPHRRDEEPGSDQSDGYLAIHEPVRAALDGRAGHADQFEAGYAAVVAVACRRPKPDRTDGVIHRLRPARASAARSFRSPSTATAPSQRSRTARSAVGPGLTISQS